MVFVPTANTAAILDRQHYLGATKRGVAWQDHAGVIVVASPTSRRLPTDWLELTRWCINCTEKNAGSRQWARFVRALKENRPDITTVISYSDPGVGHDGALYRACNWWWAPTWHRLRPPPSGNGNWSGKAQSVKDRWVFALQPDERRKGILTINDDSVLRKHPYAAYREPGGASFKAFRILQ